jgi:hypothetical protein
MSDHNWKASYGELKDYIARHQNIEITHNSFYIPSDVRPGYYEHVEKIKEEFVRQFVESVLNEAKVLIEKWNEAERKVVHDNIVLISLGKELTEFLKDPEQLAKNMVVKPLMDLIKGVSTEDDFEHNTAELIHKNMAALYADGYAKWVTLEMINFFEQDQLWGTISEDYNESPERVEVNSTGTNKEEVHSPMELHGLIFEKASMCSFLTPRVILHSAKYNRFIAIRTDPYKPLWWTDHRSQNQEWINYQQDIWQQYGNYDYWPDTYIYVADDVRDIELTSDCMNLCRPHFNIEYSVNSDIIKSGKLGRIKRHSAISDPMNGTLIISNTPIKDSELIEAYDNISAGGVGNIKYENANTMVFDGGWDLSRLFEKLDREIKTIPPYPPVLW